MLVTQPLFLETYSQYSTAESTDPLTDEEWTSPEIQFSVFHSLSHEAQGRDPLPKLKLEKK